MMIGVFGVAIIGIIIVVRLWDTGTGKPVQKLEGYWGWVNAVAFSPDGRLVASGSRDKTVRLWDTATGKPVQKLDTGGWVSRLSLSGDGSHIDTDHGRLRIGGVYLSYDTLTHSRHANKTNPTHPTNPTVVIF
jgi:WD40 repeat protein